MELVQRADGVDLGVCERGVCNELVCASGVGDHGSVC